MDQWLTLNTESTWRRGLVAVNNIQLHVVEAGSPGDPLAVLLHGFPEFWYSWRHQIPALVGAGYHVIAPDMRGYNYSSKPKGIAAYRMQHLVDDIKALIAHFEADSATVIAHDWGGVVGWSLPMVYPEIVERLAILNAPHPARYAELLQGWDQFSKAWYAMFFQLPFLPELVLSANDYAALGQMFKSSTANPHAFSDEDIRRYQHAMRQPGALTAALNYYRASILGMLRRSSPSQPRETPRITCPTLLIWGEQDVALDIANTTELDQYVDNLRVEHIPQASHWVQVDAPEQVNTLLLDFLRSS